MSKGNLSSYQGSYTEIQKGDKINLTAVFEDFSILFTTNATCKIKVKVDTEYQTSMLWHNGYIQADSQNIFDIGYTAGHSYYDDVDPTSAENPSVLKLGVPVYFGEHAIEIEVVNVANNLLIFEGLSTYKNSTRKNVRDVDTSIVAPGLQIESDIVNRRNEATVVGSERGLYMLDGLPVNPNNPLHEHTYSKVTDSNSIYNAGASNYIGRRLPMVIINSRILSQDRADHIALSAVKSYRGTENNPQFSMPADPRLCPRDAIGFREKKLNVMPDGERVWIESITEEITQSTYKQSIVCRPQAPITSFQTKKEPDWNNFNQEPIINIQLKSQGVRITGNDATTNGNTVTIGNSPGWSGSMWFWYYFYDHKGQEFRITANTGNTLTIDLGGKTPVNGNWSISFDPFDTDQLGAPLEIHYDQVINAKVEIWIKDKNGNALARVNEDTYQLTQEWGEGKVEHWSGIVKFNTKDNKAGCYVSPHSAVYENPLQVVFNVIPEDTVNPAKEIKTNGNATDDHDGTITVAGVAAVNSSIGSVRIYPKLLRDIPLIRVKSSGSPRNSEDVLFRGYVSNKQISGNEMILTLSPTPGFTTNQYQNYLIGDTKSRRVATISSNTSNTVTIITNDDYFAEDTLILIMGQGALGKNNLIHDTFRTTDNDNAGLLLISEIVDKTIGYTNVAHVYGPHSYTSASSARLSDGVNHYFEKNVKDQGQQYLERGLCWYNYYKYEQLDGSVLPILTKRYDLYPPFALRVLDDPTYRISADLTVLKVSKEEGTIKKIGKTMEDYILTENFVRPNEWAYYLSPNQLVIEGEGDNGEQNVILHNSEPNTGYYFLFEITAMDRAGRFSLNAWDASAEDMEEMYGMRRSFGYLVAWRPEDQTRNPITDVFWSGSSESDTIISGQPDIFKEMTVWE